MKTENKNSFTEGFKENLRMVDKFLIGSGFVMTALPVMPALGFTVMTLGTLAYPHLE